MLSAVRWILAYLIATLAAALVIAFYITSQTEIAAGSGGAIFLSWLMWLAVSILAAPLSIILLAVPEIFEARPNYIVWAIIGGVVGALSQFVWLATPAGEALTGWLDGLPKYELVKASVLYRLTAAAGATGGFVLAALRRSWLR